MTSDRFTLRDNARPEKEPWGIISCVEGDATIVSSKPLRGEWIRVFPQTGQDVRFLQMLDHHSEKFAPFEGGGVLIKADLLER
jgi:hypothetical protein